jgi:elongation factor G
MDHEVITQVAEAIYVHKRIFAGGGEFAKVALRLEPLPTGQGLEIVTDLVHDPVPAQLIEGIYEGVREASRRGVLAGNPVTDLRVTITGAAYHSVDSNGYTFSLAAREAFWRGMRKAGPEVRRRLKIVKSESDP